MTILLSVILIYLSEKTEIHTEVEYICNRKSNINILRHVDLEHEHVESMWFELKTKVHPILININYRSELQSHTFIGNFLT